jgi:uncharacterized membrane protein
MIRQWDLRAATVTAIACAVVALAAPIEALRALAGAPLCLFLPGYAVTAATWGKRPIERQALLLLSVASSLAVLAAGAVFLNLVPGGIDPASWTVLLLIVIIGGCLIAARRRPRAVGGLGLSLRVGIADIVLLAGAALAVAGSAVLASTPVPAKNAVGYTQLWMLPQGGSNPPVMRIGVASNEQRTTAYELEVQRGRRAAPFRSALELEPGEERVIRVPVGRRRSSEPVRITARLYRDEALTIAYRRVTGWTRPG